MIKIHFNGENMSCIKVRQHLSGAASRFLVLKYGI